MSRAWNCWNIFKCLLLISQFFFFKICVKISSPTELAPVGNLKPPKYSFHYSASFWKLHSSVSIVDWLECFISLFILFCFQSERLSHLDIKDHIPRNNMAETAENETVQRQLGTLRTSPMNCSTHRNYNTSSNASCGTNKFFRRGTRL